MKYEIEYYNGQYNRKEKEYYSHGKLRFERELINNKENGYKREYYYNGNLKCEVYNNWLSGICEKGKYYDYRGNIKK